MLKNLIKKVVSEIETTAAETIGSINNDEMILKRLSTERSWKQYKAGEIDKEETMKRAIRRFERRSAKDQLNKINKINEITAAGDLIDATLSIKWKKTREGSQAAATLQVTCKLDGNTRCFTYETRYTGGGGFDKESTAAAAALNQSGEMLKLIYKAYNDGLSLPYGVNQYKGFLPAYGHGVGISCYYSIFEAVGYKFKSVYADKTTNVYSIERTATK